MATFSRDMVYAPLRTARLYNLLQEYVGGSRDRADFVRTRVVIGLDQKVVDAGCGTGSALEFLPSVNYFGYDPTLAYIRVARSRYGSRAEFFCGNDRSPQVRQLAQDADVSLTLGVLHHLTEQQIGEILNLAQACLRPTCCCVFQ